MRALRQALGVFLQQRLDIAGNAAEVTVLRRGENIDHRLDVVMAHDGVRFRARDRRDAAQHLQAAALRAVRDGGVLQLGERIDAVFRRLHGDRVGDAVIGVEPEGRGGLRAAGQRGGEAVGDVELGQAEFGDPRAVRH